MIVLDEVPEVLSFTTMGKHNNKKQEQEAKRAHLNSMQETDSKL